MAITSGAATTDIFGWNSTFPSISLGATGHKLISFWVNPTTFTAGRYLYGYCSLSGTSELRFEQSQLTTTDKWITTGAGITVGKWSHIVQVLVSNGTTTSIRVWAGDADTRPTLCTTSFTAGSGGVLSAGLAYVNNFNNTGSGAAPAGTFAFQGTTDAWFAMSDTVTPSVSGAASDTFGLDWGLATGFTANDEQYLYNRYVLPLWFGKRPEINTSFPSYPSYSQYFFENPGSTGASTASATMGLRRAASTSQPTYAQAATQNTGIVSSNRCPRPMEQYEFSYRRR